MQKSSFFNSIDGDRKYKAEEWAEYFASFIGNGVFPEPSTNLMIEANNNMTVKVKAGKAWINGYFYYNTADLTLQLDNADGVLKRIDRIVIRWSLTNRSIEATVKKGIFASSPVAPVLQRDADIYEIGLADVLINNGVVEVTQVNITDLRQNSLYCGIVAGTVDQIDASGLFAQYEQIFNAWMTSSDQEFTTWFDSIQSILDENVAANLLNLINANTDLINAHKSDYVAQPANGGTTSGTATAYTCTSTPAPASLVDKIGVVITAHVDSGSNPTLNWNSKGAKPIKKPNGNAAVLKSGGVYTLRYNATTGNFILQGEGASGNAVASDLLSGKTASTDAGDIVGTMIDREGDTAALSLVRSGTTIKLRASEGYRDGTNDFVTHTDANDIASNIKQGVTIRGLTGTLAIGKRWASGGGAVTLSSGVVTVSGLAFAPKYVILRYRSGPSPYNRGTRTLVDTSLMGSNTVYANGYLASLNSNDSPYLYTSESFTLTSNGFTCYLDAFGYDNFVEWVAFE